MSTFQVHISDHDITTPGDEPNVLVAMNPAALRADLSRLEPGGTLIVNNDAFDERNLAKAGYAANPLTDDSLDGYRVIEVPMTSLTKEATAPLGVKPRDAERSKNFFALGLVSWMYSRPIDPTLDVDRQPVRQAPSSCGRPTAPPSRPAATSARPPRSSTTATRSGRPTLPAGEYTQHHRQHRAGVGPRGRRAARQAAGLPRQLPDHAGVRHPPRAVEAQALRRAHVQAEDEIAAVGMALGAAFAGHLGVTTTSGPGLALKSETISLAVSLELPLLVIDIQRGGPSTGLPTKTEAADLNIALYGRHGEAPLPVVAAYSPAHCFDAAIEAARIALKYRTPVILLSRRLPRQRLGAVAAARRRRAARHLGALRHRAQPHARRRQRSSSGRTSATPRRWPGRGRSPARRG